MQLAFDSRIVPFIDTWRWNKTVVLLYWQPIFVSCVCYSVYNESAVSMISSLLYFYSNKGWQRRETPIFIFTSCSFGAEYVLETHLQIQEVAADLKNSLRDVEAEVILMRQEVVFELDQFPLLPLFQLPYVPSTQEDFSLGTRDDDLNSFENRVNGGFCVKARSSAHASLSPEKEQWGWGRSRTVDGGKSKDRLSEQRVISFQLNRSLGQMHNVSSKPQ